ncbi:methylaspartate mutase subunit S [Yokenella regensburgei]|jgi:methylaspartate mutase sigma subunit|uniref:Glutamate mutase sigma subunit n=1 Tax=Yokenella regensburgei TaxID=158877 RepID=A0AB38FYM3_9ENTR|nr:methylaspartate mutase subunit S [Yokenella regensburgei]EHM51651.1 methylaspartate mutase, S subunit [Yokenella regensburgei ATCC 43003]KAF1370785.1 methylaspartate mutase sigma subunit [Yokenella regensburgei]KFD25217.1 methylaspartate mutase S chain [Yokenella regensburgei ATCC 49455]MDQ4429435.1 methylaspartate mutase subunit S [Yokenella regensburgei]MDR2216918.1 methylaspartate mutase subunit S [Yokenella regensburgei]
MKKPTLVIGVIGADCHSVGNKIMERVFTEFGFHVTNLGVMVSQDEYIDAAIETGADAIIVSSIYGHGDTDCLGMRDRCIERGVGDILLYVGGNLVVGKYDFNEVEPKFKAMGFDFVMPPHQELEPLCDQIVQDVKTHNEKLALEVC